MRSKHTNTTGKFQLNKTELAASMIRHELGTSKDDEVDPLEPDLISTNADTIHRLISQAIWIGAVSCPGEREIMIYPSSVEEPHVCVITVWDARPDGKSHLVAATLDLSDLAPRKLWESDDRSALTETVVEQIVAIANSVTDEMNAVDQITRKRAANRK